MKVLNTGVLLSGLVGTSVAAKINGCYPGGDIPKKSGFRAVAYPYVLYDLITSAEVEFVGGGYKNQSSIASIDVVPSININWEKPGDPFTMGIAYGKLYGGPNITMSNFTVELQGYYYAKESGSYTFALQQIDDTAAVFIGAGTAFDCCKDTPSGNSTDFQIFATKPSDGDPADNSKTVEMFADTYYPVRIIYVNIISQAVFNIQVTSPDGVTGPLDGSIYVIDEPLDTPDCPAFPIITTTLPWTGSDTVTSTITPSGAHDTTTVEVLTPFPTITITTLWTGSETVTSTVIGSDTVTVEILTPEFTSSSIESSTSESSSVESSSVEPSSVEPSSIEPSSVESSSVESSSVESSSVEPSSIEPSSVEPSSVESSSVESSSVEPSSIEPSSVEPSSIEPSSVESSSVESSSVDPTSSDNYSIVTKNETTVITVTSCSDNKCTEVPSTITKSETTVLTITSCSDDKCEVTTCTEDKCTAPLETATTTEVETTVITVTSCSEDSCTVVPLTTGKTVITRTSDSSTTVITTFCPLPTPEIESKSTVYVTRTVCSEGSCSEVIDTTATQHGSDIPVTDTTTSASSDTSASPAVLPSVLPNENSIGKLEFSLSTLIAALLAVISI
ncbi:hypothetical protein CAAN3_01S08614 [[Candida] anglica]